MSEANAPGLKLAYATPEHAGAERNGATAVLRLRGTARTETDYSTLSRVLQNCSRPDFVGLGGFDSHALPPTTYDVLPHVVREGSEKPVGLKLAYDHGGAS